MKKALLTLMSFGLVASVLQAQTGDVTATRADSLAGFNRDSCNALAIQAGIPQWEKTKYLNNCEEQFLNKKYGNARLGNPPTVVPMTPCTNMGFETGDFVGWSGYIGDNTVSSLGPLQNIVNGIQSGNLNPPEGSANDRHSIMSPAGGNDACGAFPVCPAGYGNFTVRLGNTTANYQGEAIEQTFVVDPANTQFTYRYAVVLDDGGHPPAEQPYFQISVFDSLGNPVNACAQYYVAAGVNNVGFTNCGGTVFYRPWTTVSFDLSGFVNQSITVRFLAAGCIWSGHYAMAYVDASCSSIADAVSATFCPGSPGAFLVGPPGFGDYQWYYPNGSPIVGATNDSLFVPSAVQGDTFSVVMHAIADTSCVTTLNVVINLTLLQTSISGVDPICYGEYSGSALQTCANCIPPETYFWNTLPPQIGPNATNLNAGTYEVITVDSIGCRDTSQITLVNPPRLDTSAITYQFCYGDVELTLIGIPGQPSYQWLDATGTPISGANQQTYLVPNPQLGDLYYCVYGTSPCPTTDSIVINYIPPINLFVADTLVNIFTPNGDGKNDFFYPFFDESVAYQTGITSQPAYDFTLLYIGYFEMWVYNRWGQEIFYTNDYNYGWDGQIDKKDGDDGVYYFICKYTSRCHLDMEPITKTGFVHLQRSKS
jgi:hypothetical protein